MPTSKAKLENLDIYEVSGVDYPANLMPGWMVMKSKGGGVEVEQIIEKAEAMDRQATELLKALEAAQGDLLDGAPEDISKSVETLLNFLAGLQETEKDAEREEGRSFLARTVAALLGLSKKEEPVTPAAEVTPEPEAPATPEINWDALAAAFGKGANVDEAVSAAVAKEEK